MGIGFLLNSNFPILSNKLEVVVTVLNWVNVTF